MASNRDEHDTRLVLRVLMTVAVIDGLWVMAAWMVGLVLVATSGGGDQGWYGIGLMALAPLSQILFMPLFFVLFIVYALQRWVRR